MAGQPTPRHPQAPANGAPTLTPLGHYAGRPNIAISRTVTLVGSRADARLHLHSSTVSKAHCLIVNTANGAYVRDLASRTKVIVNGKAHRETELHDGDKLQIGKFEFQFNAGIGIRRGKPVSFDAAPPASLNVDGGEMPLPIEDRVIVIGRRTICDVPLTEESVSTTHAVIFEMNGKRYVRDLGSRTGTFVNGKRIPEQAELAIGDELTIGETRMTYAPPNGVAEEVNDLDNLIAPVASATDLDADPLDDLAAAVATPQEMIGDIDVEPEPADEQVPLEDVPAARAPAEAEPEGAAAQDATTSEIEEELGLSPSLDARSGWRSRLLEENEQRESAKAEALVPADEAVVEPPPAAPEPQAEAPHAEEPEPEPLPALNFDLPLEAEAEVEPEVAAQDVPPAEKPLPGVAELADLARDEAPTEKDVESDEEEIKSLAVDADTADVSISDEDNIHDEVPPSPVALEEPPPIETPEFDLGEVPALELTDEPREEVPALELGDVSRDETDDAAIADAGADTLDLAPLVDDSATEDKAADVPLELETPQPAAEAPPAPEATDEGDRRAQRLRRLRRKRSEPLEINLPETPTREAPAPEPAKVESEAEPVEVIDHTQPTPESAQSLEDAVADLLAEPALDKSDSSFVDTGDLTDTAFGRNVESFAGESTGPLVEARADETHFEAHVEPIDETSLHDTPFVAAEPAAAAVEAETAGQAEAESPEELEAAEALAIEALASETNAETIDITAEEITSVAPPPLHQQVLEDLAEPVAEVEVEAVTEPAFEAVTEPEPEPEPVAEAPKPEDAPVPAQAPKIDLTGWGPNQEHFLGGMPLRLNDPPPRPVRREPARPAAEAPRGSAKRGAPPQRSPFDLTPNDVPAEDFGRSVPPYAGNNPKKGSVTTGFDGLAMPPVRQLDVFSQMSTPSAFVNGILGADDVFGGKTGALPGERAAPITAARFTPIPNEKQPASRGGGAGGGEPPRPGKNAAQPQHEPEAWDKQGADAAAVEAPAHDSADAKRGARAPAARPPTIPPNAAEAYPMPPRKRRWFGLGGLLIMMLVCMGVAVAGIFAFVPPRAIVQGTLSFQNFAALNEMEQRTLKNRQQQILAAPELRQNAHTLLRTSDPDATPGFLNDGAAFSQIVAGSQWDGGKLVLRRDGSNPKLDQQRLFAVLTALYQSNGDLVEEARKLRGRVDALADAHAKAQQRAEELKGSIARMRAAAEDRPEQSEITALEQEAAKLEAAWGAAAAKAKGIEVDLNRSREGLSPAPQPAGTAAVPVVDPQLTEFEQKLGDLNNQIAQLQQAQSTRAQDARKQLDSAIGAFEKEVNDATAAAQGAQAGPELTAYLAEAQKLRQSTRALTDKLVTRQQEQTDKLTKLKASLGEKRESRKAELVQKDPELKKWNEELAMAQRQHGAAVSAGLKNDADEYAAHVSTLQKMIAARQSLIGDDALLADAIGELEKIIDETTKTIEADRLAMEATFEENQKALIAAQPALAKLPADQQALASNVSDRLAAVTAARLAFTTAAAGTAGESSDEQLGKLRDEAAALATTVAQRRKQLAAASEKTQLAAQEQGHMTALKEKETELAAARDAERAAQAQYLTAVKNVNAAQARLASAREAGEKNDAAKRELDVAEKDAEQTLRSLQAAQAQLAKKVDPIPPEQNQVSVVGGRDVRERYSLITLSSIALVFAGLIFFSVRAERSAAAAARAVGEDDWGDPAATAALAPLDPGASPNGNGHTDSHHKPGRHEDDARVSV